MPNLHVRDVPAPTYELLKERAKKNRRSLNSEVLQTLEAGLQAGHLAVAEIVRRIESRPPLRPGAPSSAELIRRIRGPLPRAKRRRR